MIPRAKLVASPADPDYVLVDKADVALYSASIPDTDESDQPARMPPPSIPDSPDADVPRIRSRPQAGNGQNYFTILHQWAGRAAGGFGKPMGGLLGQGKYGKWAHRHISSVRDERKLSDEKKISILDGYNEASAKLFEQWLSERNLLGYVQRVNAPQFYELLMNGGVTYHGWRPSESHYYEMPLDIDYHDGRWVRAYHGTYFYTLWNILISGFMGSGIKAEGGDTHMPEPGIVYTTPNPDLAYSYACPQQLFGNGFLYKVVLDLRVRKDKLNRKCNSSKFYNSEETYFAKDVHVAGFWLFTDAHATSNDSRILEWDPKFETIPESVVESWHADKANIEIAMPAVITDPAPKLMPICLKAWEDHVMIQTSPL